MKHGKDALVRWTLLLFVGAALFSAAGCQRKDDGSTNPDPGYYKGKLFHSRTNSTTAQAQARNSGN